MKNRHHIKDGIAYIHLTAGELTTFALIDEVDLPLVESYPNTWSLLSGVNNDYVVRRRWMGEEETLNALSIFIASC